MLRVVSMLVVVEPAYSRRKKGKREEKNHFLPSSQLMILGLCC